MRNEQYFQRGNQLSVRLAAMGNSVPRKAMVGVILMVSLAAFEMFNFDTTQYALRNLLGDVRFLNLQWASILAIAFCSIDFAGLIRLFTPEKGVDEPKEVWYLMGAWLLGATMNAIMTWWAVSLTLLNHSFGNEVLTREQLLSSVPIFVAVLVWLTRILFIGAFTVAGEHLFDFSSEGMPQSQAVRTQPVTQAAQRKQAAPVSEIVNRQRPAMPSAPQAQPMEQPAPQQRGPALPQRQNSRVRQRPPRPNGAIRRVPAGVHARPRR
ncbi:MAG: hypothetical protein H6662_12700 [Ardenticatenaceae bacterium]|nr:hypothetical protein [Anaerolineales bacterium]MCB8922437.1 hypothetical protein [Ardenticatenaceae bacterium]